MSERKVMCHASCCCGEGEEHESTEFQMLLDSHGYPSGSLGEYRKISRIEIPTEDYGVAIINVLDSAHLLSCDVSNCKAHAEVIFLIDMAEEGRFPIGGQAWERSSCLGHQKEILQDLKRQIEPNGPRHIFHYRQFKKGASMPNGSRTQFYKNEDQFGIKTAATSERDFLEDFSKFFSEAVDSGIYAGDHEFQLNGWLPKVIEICCSYRGYKSEVNQERVITCGNLSMPVEFLQGEINSRQEVSVTKKAVA
ncbi:MAG TPA: hypothetical protein VJ044_16020 [Candidatus Hodarchaeales archaeon]|nr:hypothetical protein [Candidatus Hodarchaeales archaeon]